MHYSFYVAFVGLFDRHDDRSHQQSTSGRYLVRDPARQLDISSFYYGDFYLMFKAAMDTFFLLLIGACSRKVHAARVAHPTLLSPPPADKVIDNFENRLGYWFPMTMLVLVALTGLMLEGARINATASELHRMGVRRAPTRRDSRARSAPARCTIAVCGSSTSCSCIGLLFCFPFTKLRHLVFAPDQSVFPQPRAARTARSDQGFRERRDFRRLAGRAVHLEAIARYGVVPRMRAMHDQLPDRQHRQDAQSEIPRHRAARASAADKAPFLLAAARGEKAARRRGGPSTRRSRHDHRGRDRSRDLGMHDLRMVRGRMPGRDRAHPANRRHAPPSTS